MNEIDLDETRIHRQASLSETRSYDDDEITRVARLPVTTPARTAYDLGRLLPRGGAVARLDALKRATPFSVEDVLLLARRYQGAVACDSCGPCCHLSTAGPRHRKRLGCGCC